MKYNQELNIMLAKANKTKRWLQSKLGFDRQTFWRKCSKDKLTDGQKEKIKKLLSR